MSFSKDSSPRSVAVVEAIDTDQIEALAARPRRRARARRPAVHPRRRRLGRSRVARGQRLPQDLRHRGVRARPTTSPSSPRGPTTRAGTPRSAAWLKGRGSRADDALLIFSVGGGDDEKNVSRQHRRARSSWRRRSAHTIFGIVGRDGGYTAKLADACVVIPPLFPATSRRTPKACARWSGTCSSSHPALARTATRGSRLK